MTIHCVECGDEITNDQPAYSVIGGFTDRKCNDKLLQKLGLATSTEQQIANLKTERESITKRLREITDEIAILQGN